MFEIDVIFQIGRTQTPSSIDYLFTASIAGYALYLVAEEKIRELVGDETGSTYGDDDLDDLRERYVSGDISIEEFETRVGICLDEDAREARATVERVDGIGPETSAAIAQEFGTIDAIATADQDALEDVDGVGPTRAETILQEL